MFLLVVLSIGENILFINFLHNHYIVICIGRADEQNIVIKIYGLLFRHQVCKGVSMETSDEMRSRRKQDVLLGVGRVSLSKLLTSRTGKLKEAFQILVMLICYIMSACAIVLSICSPGIRDTWSCVRFVHS